MGSEIVYCHLCGGRIVEKDLLSGRALTLLDKTFCHLCKEKAFSQMRTEEPSTGVTAPLPRPPVPAGAPGVRSAAPKIAAAPLPRVTREPREVPPPPKRRNPLPLYIGGTVGFLAIISLLIILKVRRDTPAPPPIHGGGGGGTVNPKPDGGDTKAPDPALAAIKELEEFARAAAPDDVMRKCEQLAGVLRGSKYDDRWMKVRSAAETKRTLSASEQELKKLIDSVNDMIKRDPDYQNFPNIYEKIRAAADVARNKHPEMLSQVDELERLYITPYEDKAREWSDAHSSILHTLEQEKRYKDAMGYIARFPEKYKHSKVYKQLKRQYDDYEKKLKDIAAGGAGHGWKQYYTAGQRDLGSRNKTAAKENYKKALGLIPQDWKTALPAEERKLVLFIYYDLGCIDADDAKKAEKPEDKEKLNKTALEWLEKSFRDGLFQTACPCHGKWDLHIPKDEDLDDLRNDQRFKDLLAKYQK